jgi:hypothetical protein
MSSDTLVALLHLSTLSDRMLIVEFLFANRVPDDRSGFGRPVWRKSFPGDTQNHLIGPRRGAAILLAATRVTKILMPRVEEYENFCAPQDACLTRVTVIATGDHA